MAKTTQPELKAAATVIAEKVHGGGLSGFPIVLVIEIVMMLIKQLMACMQPDPANQEAHVKDYVTRRWMEGEGYDESLMRRTMHQARRAGRRSKKKVKLDDDQQRELAIAALDEARLGKADAVVISQALADQDSD